MSDIKIPESTLGKTLDQKNNNYQLVLARLNDTTEGARLGVTGNTDLADTTARHTSGWLVNHPKTLDPLTRGSHVIKLRNEDGIFIEDRIFKVFDAIAENKYNTADRDIFNHHLRKDPSERSEISVAPFINVHNVSGGFIGFEARVQEDSSRPSMHEDADVVEIVYVLDTEPANAAACNQDFQRKIASFKRDFSTQIGHKIYGFGRWVNLEDGDKSSPFSTMFTITIGS